MKNILYTLLTFYQIWVYYCYQSTIQLLQTSKLYILQALCGVLFVKMSINLRETSTAKDWVLNVTYGPTLFKNRCLWADTSG